MRKFTFRIQIKEFLELFYVELKVKTLICNNYNKKNRSSLNRKLIIKPIIEIVQQQWIQQLIATLVLYRWVGKSLMIRGIHTKMKMRRNNFMTLGTSKMISLKLILERQHNLMIRILTLKMIFLIKFDFLILTQIR